MEINHVIKIESWEQKHFFLYYPDESHEQLLFVCFNVQITSN